MNYIFLKSTIWFEEERFDGIAKQYKTYYPLDKKIKINQNLVTMMSPSTQLFWVNKLIFDDDII